ncbi:MAG: YIP1 family protein [Pseudomonadota bacterium]
MNLVQRVQAILLKPRDTWPIIEAEASDAASIYKNYLVILAAIPAVAGFIGMTLIGVGGFGMTFKLPLLTGLVQMVLSYVLSLVMIYVLALITDALAPAFGGQKNPLNALKLVAYASTAGLVGGIFGILPWLGMLGLLAALYSLYLIYLGLPVLMKNPPEKSLAYTAVLLVCSIVAGVGMAALSHLFMPTPAMPVGHPDAGVTLETPQGKVQLDAEKLDAWSARMKEASERMEAAQKSGDPAAIEQAMKDMMQTLGQGQAASPPQDPE